MSRRVVAALLVVVGGACGGGQEAAPSAGRVTIELTQTNAESSKDSHDSIERYRLAGGTLHWETETKGYGEDRIPKKSGDVVLAEADVVRVAELCAKSGLTTDATEEAAGGLGGPGSVLTVEASVTVDGATGKSRVVALRPWNGAASPEGARMVALRELRDQLAAIAAGRR